MRNAFRFVENQWAVTTKEIFEIIIMNCNVGLLKNELIDLQQDITLKDIFLAIYIYNFYIFNYYH